MILVIDNYDSFTYNLVQYFGQLGDLVEIYRNDKITIEEIRELNPDRIVLSPGPGTPDTAGVTIQAIEEFAREIPILDVCLGHQAIGQAFGGRITDAPHLMHGKTSRIYHVSRTIFRGLLHSFIATRYHSLIVDNDGLPDCLEVSARTADGLVMGLRHRAYPVEGVQFHPESILTENGKRLLKNFLRLKPSKYLRARA
jgi:anthranilate synthase/aminodeoxychorismate synthase-like glutamine amidotransferase